MPTDESDSQALWRRIDEHNQGLSELRAAGARADARITAMEERMDRHAAQVTHRLGELGAAQTHGFAVLGDQVSSLRDEVVARRGEDALRNRLIGWGIALAGVVIAGLAVMNG